jgi:hypothetical protein
VTAPVAWRRRWPAAVTAAGFDRLLAFVAVAAVSALVARWAGITGLQDAPLYLGAVTLLLALGLYGATSAIDLRSARQDAAIVSLAVTVGVVAKAAIIAAVMWAIFRRPEMAVLGVAVAQIDPLSVAAIRERSRLSPRARTVLAAWSSFDDPITALLTVYLVAWLLPGGSGDAAHGLTDAGGVLVQLAFNVLLVAVTFGLWLATARVPSQRWRLGLQRALLLGAGTVAVWRFLMLGLATVGLFLRPRLAWLIERVTQVAFWLAVVVIGVGLADGMRPLAGLVLGVAAFASQVVVSVPVTRRMPREDRVDLALGHQNGITAIILALLLEPLFPGTIAVVGPAIVVVNVLHGVSNAIWARLRPPPAGPDPAAADDNDDEAVSR